MSKLTDEDRMSDAELGAWSQNQYMAGNLRSMARELLAFRRASQADPEAWLIEDLHRVSRVPKIATTARKHVEGIYSDPTEFKVTPLYAAPSAGLREALDLLLQTPFEPSLAYHVKLVCEAITKKLDTAPVLGNSELDGNAPNHFDHSKRGFNPR